MVSVEEGKTTMNSLLLRKNLSKTNSNHKINFKSTILTKEFIRQTSSREE